LTSQKIHLANEKHYKDGLHMKKYYPIKRPVIKRALSGNESVSVIATLMDAVNLQRSGIDYSSDEGYAGKCSDREEHG
jgi:hypothetical protein